MFRSLMMAAAILIAPSALARSQCDDYNRYGSWYAQQYCNQDRDCSWNGRYCIDRYTRPDRCENIRSSYQCANTRGCEWDRWYGCQTDRTGGGGSRRFQCTAADQGWEEHRGGHTATGRTQYEASVAAAALCERYHGSCYVTRCTQY
jgi:hypothetical protein